MIPQLRKREGQSLNFGLKNNRAFVPDSFRDSISVNTGLVRRLARESILDGHTNSVYSIDWNETGDLLLSASADCTVKLWDISNGRLLRDSFLSGHTGSIFCTKFLPCSSDEYILTCGADHQIRLLNVPTKATKSFSCHRSRVKDLAMERNNPHVFLSGSEDGTVRQIDLRENYNGFNDNDKAKVLVDLRKQSRSSFRSGDSGVQISTYISSRVEICHVCIHPTRPYEFTVGGGDPVVRVYDRRMLLSSDDPKKRSCTLRYVPSTIATSRYFPRYHVSDLAYNHDGTQLLVSYYGENVYTFPTHHSANSSEIKSSQASQNSLQPTKRNRSTSSLIHPQNNSIQTQTPTQTQNQTSSNQRRPYLSTPPVSRRTRPPISSTNSISPSNSMTLVDDEDGNVPPEVHQFVMELGRDIRNILSRIQNSRETTTTPNTTSITTSTTTTTPETTTTTTTTPPTESHFHHSVHEDIDMHSGSTGSDSDTDDIEDIEDMEDTDDTSSRMSIPPFIFPSTENRDYIENNTQSSEDYEDEDINHSINEEINRNYNTNNTNNNSPNESVQEILRQLRATPFGVRLNILGIRPEPLRGALRGTPDPIPPWFDGDNFENNTAPPYDRSRTTHITPSQPPINGDFLRCYSGHRNSSTAMGINFFGPKSEYIVGGSDLGGIFVWETS